MTIEGNANTGDYPREEDLKKYDGGRRRRGVIWGNVFLASTMVGIIALTALLYNVVNSAFGYVAIQNEIDPASLVMQVVEQELLTAPNTTESEDDNLLANAIAENPYAVGFFGYAYYSRYEDRLQTVSVEGVSPSAATVNNGEYPLARPLYLYSGEEILANRPHVADFLDFYLANVNSVIQEVGYFPVDDAQLAEARSKLRDIVQEDGAPSSGDILVGGSSTVYPLTARLAEEYQIAGGDGTVSVESVGTKAGFARFCGGDDFDIVNASRAIARGELEACRKVRQTPMEFRVGTDALAVVVSQQNTFLKNASFAEMEQIFTSAERWSDVNAEWPDEPIIRFIPGRESGTLDYFVETVFDLDLAALSKAELTAILEKNVSAGLIRRFEFDQPFAERSTENVRALVVERVVAPTIVQSWPLMASLFKRTEIEAAVAKIPNGDIQFRSWVNLDFVRGTQSSTPDDAGIRTAILGSLWVILITILFSLPVGVGAAIYLEEYAADNWFNNLIETNINNLAGVPSIIYGMLGLAIFVRALEPITSGTLLGIGDPTTANGRTVISAGLTLGLLILPLIIINAREAVRAVPSSLRQASLGLGATKWQTIWSHVLPSSLAGILTGTILAISRAIGETAPLVVVGASTFIVVDPSSPFAKFTTLPIQIYQWTSRPQAEFRNLAAAAIIVLLLLLLTLNATAVILRNRYSSQRV